MGKFDECSNLQRQIYDLEQSMNRISENPDEYDEDNTIYSKNIEIEKLKKQLNEAKNSHNINTQPEISNDINNASAEIGNIKDELEHKSFILQREEENFKKFEKHTNDEIKMHKNKLDQLKSKFNPEDLNSEIDIIRNAAIRLEKS